MRTVFALIGLCSAFTKTRASGWISSTGVFACMLIVGLTLPLRVEALTSTSFRLEEEAPNYAERDAAVSTSYQINENGVTWFQVPLASTNFQIATTLVASSSSASSAASSESVPPATPSGGRRGHETTRPGVPSGSDTLEPEDRPREPAAPEAPAGEEPADVSSEKNRQTCRLSREQIGVPSGALRGVRTVPGVPHYFMQFSIDLTKYVHAFPRPSPALPFQPMVIRFLQTILGLSLLSMLGYLLLRARNIITLLHKRF